MNNEIVESQAAVDAVQTGFQIGSMVPALLKDYQLLPKSPSVDMKDFPSLAIGLIGERAIKQGAKIIDRLKNAEISIDSDKAVDTAVQGLKDAGLDPKAADLFGKLMKTALKLSTDVKSVSCSLTKDGKAKFKVEFNSPISSGLVTLGEKDPFEFTLSPAADNKGVEFTGIKGAQVGIGPLKTDVTSASLTFKDGDPKLTVNNK
ncbi:MAG: hypothetical protein K2Z81_14200, partial [Cyanobacteria bacterium]|nr:hypothetical protein [Cyanobacteriota bacterium]